MTDYLAEAQALFDYTRAFRRDFHQHPELGFQEFRTAGIVARELRSLGLDRVQTGVAQTGVVGLLEGSQPGPVVLLRFDMDALPITEETQAVYASQNAGVMHACGHDGHTAVGLTVARMLTSHRQALTGTVKFVFQPAEEGLGGADAMVKAGLLQDPRPDYALAIHVWNENQIGWLGITPGPIMAAADIFRIKITGKGGHGAAPHQTIDPVLAACQVVTSLQSIVSRNIHPLESAVVSVTSIQGGTAFNIIPPDVVMMGTIRTFKPDVRQVVLDRFREITNGISESLGCTAHLEVTPVTPAVSNDPELTRKVQAVAARLFPDDTVASDSVTMGSEDFAYMMQDFPGCFVFVGSANPAAGLDAKHHHPKFDFDELALVKATALVAAVTSEILSK
jgi:amidohydrolase